MTSNRGDKATFRFFSLEATLGLVASVLLASQANGKLMVAEDDMVRRDFDPLTRVTANTSSTLELLFQFEAFPVYMGVESVADSATDPQDDVFAKMSWYISRTSGIVQLNPLVPLRYVYLHQHNAVVGGTWHCKRFFTFPKLCQK